METTENGYEKKEGEQYYVVGEDQNIPLDLTIHKDGHPHLNSSLYTQNEEKEDDIWDQGEKEDDLWEDDDFIVSVSHLCDPRNHSLSVGDAALGDPLPDMEDRRETSGLSPDPEQCYLPPSLGKKDGWTTITCNDGHELNNTENDTALMTAEFMTEMTLPGLWGG